MYAELVAQGVRTGVACRLVGVAARTGYRWRQEAAAAAAAAAAGAPVVVVVSAGFLSLEERVVIGDRLLAGVRQAAIAAELGRPRCTISREIARNQDPDGGGYQPFAAQQRAERRRARPKTPKLAGNPVLRDVVQDLLAAKYSPAQISARLRHDFPDRDEFRVSHETIYQAFYVQGRGALRRELATALRTGRAVRRPRTTSRRPAKNPIRRSVGRFCVRWARGKWTGEWCLPGFCRWMSGGDRGSARAGVSQVGISAELGRPRCTTSREIRRNRVWPMVVISRSRFGGVLGGVGLASRRSPVRPGSSGRC
ncbi:helix-turn-helix domain-containing protein [Dactylosporangium sp. NPDC000244]|uniref:helix-turn-helix domain-containing protein n=1 Tax=Dactylosporangium sp. NPDC000244 TaxID=3154365 RepID=UPI00332809AD